MKFWLIWRKKPAMKDRNDVDSGLGKGFTEREMREPRDHTFYMRLALEQAALAKQSQDIPVGAILVCDDQIVAAACNTKEASGIATRHAEINAIEQAEQLLGRWRLSGCTLYVTLEPCPMCAGAIQQARIDKVVFGARDYKHGAYGSLFNMLEIKGLNHYPEVLAGVLESPCSEILSQFFAEMRREKKERKEALRSL